MSLLLRAALLLTPCLVACHLTEDLEDCARHSDCASDERCTPERFCEKDNGPIVIGALVPLGDGHEAHGLERLSALGLVAKVVEEAGGIHGRQIRFIGVDDRLSGEVFQAEIIRLIEEEKAVAFVGASNSNRTLEAQAVTAPRKILLITPEATSLEISAAEPELDRYTFRTTATVDRGEGLAMAAYLGGVGNAEGACQKVALIHTGSAFSLGYQDALARYLPNLFGVSLVIDPVVIPPEPKISYDEEFLALRSSGADCVVAICRATTGPVILRAWDEFIAKEAPGWADVRFFGSSTWQHQAFLDEAHAQSTSEHFVAEGISGAAANTTPNTPEFEAFAAAYNEFNGRALGTPIPPYIANAYDAGMLIALSLLHAGGPSNPQATRNSLWAISGVSDQHQVVGPLEFEAARNRLFHRAPESRGQIHYRGASGSLIFDPTGTVSGAAIIWEVVNGAFSTAHHFSDLELDALRTPEASP